MSIEQDLQRLGLTGRPSPDEIRIAYRRLARRNHPDLGGTTSSMAEINASFARLEALGTLPPATAPAAAANAKSANHVTVEYVVEDDRRRGPMSMLRVLIAIAMVPITIATIGVVAILILYGLVTWW